LNPTLKNPAELVTRLELAEPERLLLVDAPEELANLLEAARAGPKVTVRAEGDALRAVKETFPAVLVWREHRGGSHAVLDGAVKKLEPGGALWVVTALRKVRGPSTPAVHRLERADLVKAFEKEGLSNDREVRVTAWHVGFRFVPTPRTGRTSP
jgi:hypothetical protein